jgi:hypothetical protein
MSKGNNFVFTALHIVAWIIFVGLSIEAGALIVNFVFSLVNPDFVQNLYQKLDLSEVYNRSESAFFGMYSFVLVIALLKAYLFYEVVRLCHSLHLSKPFSDYASRKMKRIGSITLSIGIMSYVASEVANYLEKRGFDLQALQLFWTDAQAFVLMSAVIFVIAAIFSKGLEIQTENELTI